MTTPFDFLRSRTIWYFALILAIYLFSGCNYFLTPCSEEVVCTTLADGGGTEDGGIIGPTRKFEWRAKVQVVPNRFKFVGMKGTTAVFLANEDKAVTPNLPLRWDAYQLDLHRADLQQRIEPGVISTSYPAAPSHDFLNTPILVSGGYFYGLFSVDKTIKSVALDLEIRKGVQLPDSLPYVYFRHPEQNALAVTAKPTWMGAQSGTLIRWPSGGTVLMNSSSPSATALVMGDLDATDPIPTGHEVILLKGNQVQEIWHQGSGSSAASDDSHLKVGLQDALDRNEKGSLILAGFVSSLNADKFVDFVYARGSKLYVTSYIGRSPSGIGLFQDWPNDKMPSFSIEKVRSIQAIDLTQDTYPELVVETDQAVHFYLSKP
ncbi:MAG: hypothetical protein JNM83_13180 [Myxococcales bacterium]|jgi:hypothetical protein|nr:hypothetical protein [Myxococcales bacterium]